MARPAKTMLEPKPGKDKLFIKQGTKPETIEEAIKPLKGGESRGGFLGKGNILRKPDYVPPPENLDEQDAEKKRVIQNLLANVIEPNSLSAKSTPALDKRSLVQKLNKSTLDELKGLLPDRLKRLGAEKLKEIVEGTAQLSDEEQAEIQDLYKDVSP